MKKTTIITSLCAVALMSGAFVANAEARPHMKDRTAISAEDRAKLTEQGNAFADKTQPLYNEIEDKHYELKKLYRADNPDQAAISKIESDISAIRVKLFQEREAFRLQLQKDFPNHAMDRDGMMGGMHGGMGGGMMGGMGCGNYEHDGYERYDHRPSKMHR